MALKQTQLKGRDVGDGSMGRADLNVTLAGQAVIRKMIDVASSGVKISSYTGVDPGTGDVGMILDWTFLDTRWGTSNWAKNALKPVYNTSEVAEVTNLYYTDTRVNANARVVTAYNHSQTVHDKSFVGLNLVDNTADANKSVNYATTAHVWDRYVDGDGTATSASWIMGYDSTGSKWKPFSSAVTKNLLSLNLVDNTADINKSVNYAASAGKVVNYIPHASTNADSTSNNFYTSYGYISLGPMNNGGSAHIYTGQANFYFNKELMVNGNTVYHSANLPAYPTRASLAVDQTNNTADANKSVNFATTAGSAYIADKLFVVDSRDAVTTPNTYTTPSTRFEFKSNTASGLADGGGFVGLFSFRKYGGSPTDWTGGGASQLAFTDAGNLWTRYGTADTWGAWHKIYHDGNLPAYPTNADTVDSLHGTDFFRMAVGATLAQVNNTALTPGVYRVENQALAGASGLNLYNYVWNFGQYSGTGYAAQLTVPFHDGVNQGAFIRVAVGANYGAWQKMWTEGNDGTGSGLDADLLDGQHGAYYQPAGNYFKFETFTADANTLPGNRSSFSYALNAPNSGPLAHFDATGYGLQLSGAYLDTTGSFSMRTKNGDNGTWNPWRNLWHSGNFNPASYLSLTGGTLSGALSSSSYIQSGDWVGAPSGISLYSVGNNSGTYGIQFVPTGNSGYGTHGAVTGDYATYFNMDASPNRGWIFRSGSGSNVASINNGGVIAVKQLIPANNTRSDGGRGGIDFYDTGIGYPYAAKIYTFKSPSEFYGFTNDYAVGSSAEFAIISDGGGGGNIGFYVGGGTADHLSTRALKLFPNKIAQFSGMLHMAEGAYTATIKLGSNTTWNCGISQRDAGNAEMRIWAKNATLGSIYIATGHDGELATNTLPTDGLCVKNNKVGIGNFPSYSFPSYNLEVQGSAFCGSLYVSTTLNVNGNFTQEISHGQNHQLFLSAAENLGGGGSISLYTWISEPGMTWTGAAIARNISNTTGFARVNTGMSAQMMRFDEGNGIEFKIETAAGTRWTPLSMNGNDVTFGGSVQINGMVTASGGGYNSLRELKNIHKDWGGNALNVISKFKIRDFNYKTSPDYNRTLGFIIDEIPKEIGDYALSGEERNVVNTYTLHGLSFKGLQEVKTKLDVQEGELDWQSAKIILLEKRIMELEGRLN